MWRAKLKLLQMHCLEHLFRNQIKQPSIFLIDASVHAEKCIETLLASSRKIQEIKEAQHSDPDTAKVIQHCESGWPDFMPDTPLMKQYWETRHHLTVIDELILFDDRIVIPIALRLDILQWLHEGHQGITKTKALASTCVWWSYTSNQIETMVNKCATCAIHRPEHKEPLFPSNFSDRSWSHLAMDLFELKGKIYLIVVDYFSQWIELQLLEKLNSKTTITQIKSVFATHGIPHIIISDIGPQFVGWEFNFFAQECGFTHVTSCPRYPRSNGEAGRAVRTIKNLVKKAADPYDTLLSYRATPLNNEYSPAELMCKKLNTKIPTIPTTLSPPTPSFPQLEQKESIQKQKQRMACREGSLTSSKRQRSLH